MSQAVIQILDHSFPSWQLLKITVLPDSINSNSSYLDSIYGYSNFYTCDLNGDKIPDYALAITTKIDSSTVEHFIALISTDKGYVIYKLAEYNVNQSNAGTCALYLTRKGEQITDFDPSDSSPVTFKTDAITYFSLQGCCSTTFVFENGSFRHFTSSD